MREQFRFLVRFSLIFFVFYFTWKLLVERVYLQGLILAFVAMLSLMGHRDVRVGNSEKLLISYRGLDQKVDVGLVAMSLLPWISVVAATPKLTLKEKARYGLLSAAGIFTFQVAFLVSFFYGHHVGYPFAAFLEVFLSSVILMALPFIAWWAFMISPPSSRPERTSRARRRR